MVVTVAILIADYLI